MCVGMLQLREGNKATAAVVASDGYVVICDAKTFQASSIRQWASRIDDLGIDQVSRKGPQDKSLANDVLMGFSGSVCVYAIWYSRSIAAHLNE